MPKKIPAKGPSRTPKNVGPSYYEVEKYILYWEFKKNRGFIELTFDNRDNIEFIITDPAEFQAAADILRKSPKVFLHADTEWIFSDRLVPGT